MTIPGLSIDSSAATPVYRQIAEGIQTALYDGRLTAGQQLPPTRELAKQLDVNRNTVIAAYDLLVELGVATGQTGRGTFLAGPLGGTSAGGGAGATSGDPWLGAFARAVQGAGVGNLVTIYRVATSHEGISLAGGYPAAELMPVEAFARAMERTLRERGPEVLSYGPTAGYGPLRETIAAEMRRKGSPSDASSILVTNGSQQALELAFRAFVDPGDAVVVEDPTYTGAISAFAALGARLVGVPLDDQGIRPDLLEVALSRHRPRLMYVQPTFHNPTARVMGEGRRRDVLAVAARHRCIIVEDDWAGDLRFAGRDLPTLHALDGGQHVLYLSTFSKKLLPGLRVGWVAAPEPVFDRLLALKQIEDCGTSPLVQAALHAFIADGAQDDHLARVRAAYLSRSRAMDEAIRIHFPDGARFTRSSGGLFSWVALPETVDGDELFAAARERGVLVGRGSLFHVGGGGRNTLRLTFSSVGEEQIREGIAVLGDLLRQRWPKDRTAARERNLEAVPIL
jgi:DNA-binding transcriptional MocR family regulator